jgi:hypothetical protein
MGHYKDNWRFSACDFLWMQNWFHTQYSVLDNWVELGAGCSKAYL